jgi:ligand-binding sensor domain-containing protein
VYNGNGSTPTFKHIFKTTNLTLPGTVTWTEMDTGIPDVSVNAFVIDPANTSHLYAGTDRGVFYSADGGTTWNLYGIGLPDVAVFDLAISSDGHLRAATHGRGFYEIVKAP